MAFAPELKKNFERLVQNGRLSHGYIFFGASPAEQRLFAEAFSNYLEFGSWEKSVKPLVDAFFMDETAVSGIDAAREMSRFIWQKPVSSARRTVVVAKADALTVPAQNAILKVAEEPPEHGLFILSVQDPEALIPPLASRFQKVFFSGRGASIFSEEIRKLVAQVLRAPTARARTEIIKIVLEQESAPFLRDFINCAILALQNDLSANWRILKELLRRLSLMRQYNLNKKLQLEAAFMRDFTWKN